jgi:hypothetical protein
MGTYIRLVEYNSADAKKAHFSTGENRFSKNQIKYLKIPGNPIAYWISKSIFEVFNQQINVGSISEPRVGMATANNELFIRQWWEVFTDNISFHSYDRNDAMNSLKKWFPFTIGGEYRKWYGNNICLVDWEFDGKKIRNFKDKTTGRIRSHNYNLDYIFKNAITWSSIGTDRTSFRYVPNGYLFSNSGYGLFANENYMLLLAILNHQISKYLLNTITPSMGFEPGYVAKIPVIQPASSTYMQIVKKSISISKSDWDLRETSWDFLRSCLLTDYYAEPIETEIDENLTDVSWPSSFGKVTEIGYAIESFKAFWKKQFLTLHANEEKLNKTFIDLYGLEDELTHDVPYNEITILQEELDPKVLKKKKIQYKDDEIVRQFIFYAVGCIFGRYSLDVDGLVLANAGEGVEEYLKQVPEPSFMPDESGILPITEEDDFSDDLPSQFRNFLRVSFGEENFQENLRYIEDVLGKSIRDYLRNNFYKDHVQRYKKRPIYWMITSPSGALKALIYLHRYTKDTVNVFLNDYLRPFEHKIDYKIKGLSQVLVSASSSASEKTKAQKQIDKLNKVKTELETWERNVVYDLAVKRIELDLDDGVKVNYGKLGSILEIVKGLNE